MKADPAAIDAATFFDQAVREGMLTESVAKDLLTRSTSTALAPWQLSVEAGRLTPIQADAVLGVLSPGSIAEDYEVTGLLGYGGIGIVYRARQPSLDRIVALKTISTSRLIAEKNTGASRAFARFQQEAVAIAKLKHPNIVTAYDYGARDERLFLAMELVDGVSLDAHIRRAGRLDEGVAWRIAGQVAAALAHAYELGVVHRDIKPPNLLLTDPPTGYPLPPGTPLVKVTDFGLARLNASGREDEDTRLTIDGAVMGTPHYMAPEQLEDANVGFEADLYALGATVYHMIAGEPPLADLPLMKIVAAKVTGAVDPLHQLPEHVSPPSRELLSELLAHDPKERPQSHDDLLSKIKVVLQDEVIEASVGDAAAFSALTLDTPMPFQGAPTLDLNTAENGSKRTRVALMAISLAVLVALAATPFASSLLTAGPPQPRFVVSDAPQDIHYLFQGFATQPWSGVALGHGEFAGWLRILTRAERPIDELRQTLPEPDHFGFSFRIALKQGEALEVWLDDTAKNKTDVTRISDDALSIGRRSRPGQPFEAIGEPVELTTTSLAPHPVVQFTRDESRWFVQELPPGDSEPRTLGWFPITGAPPAKIRLKAEGDAVHIGEVQLIALIRAEEEQTP